MIPLSQFAPGLNKRSQGQQPIFRFYQGWESCDGRAQQVSGAVFLTHVLDSQGNIIPMLTTVKQEVTCLPAPPEFG